jgi:hypothetical protein
LSLGSNPRRPTIKGEKMFSVGDKVYHTKLKRFGKVVPYMGLMYDTTALMVDFGTDEEEILEVTKAFLLTDYSQIAE